MPGEETMQCADRNGDAALDQPCLDLGKGYIALFGNQPKDEVAVCFDLAGMPVTAALFGNCTTVFQSKLSPAYRTRGANTKMSRGPAATHAAINCGYNSVSKIL